MKWPYFMSSDRFHIAHPKLFILLAIPLGLVMLCITPPLQSPDEQNHFYKAWHVSKGNLFADKTSDNRLGAKLPRNLEVFTQPYEKYIRCHHCRINFSDFRRDLAIQVAEEDRAFLDFANTGFYFPLNYLPQALGIWLGSGLSLPLGQIFYLSRLVNFLFWVGLCALTIHFIPFYKDLFTLILLLPSSLAFHISLNQDVFLHGLAFVFLAFIFRLRAKPNKTPFSLWSLSLGLGVLTTMKPSWLPLGILFMLLLNKSNSLVKKTVIWLGLCLPAVIAFMFIRSQSADQFIPYEMYNPAYRDSQTLNPGVDPEKQLAFIFKQPFSVLGAFAISYLKAIPSLMGHYFGKFGWLANYLPPFMVILLFVGTLSTTQGRKQHICPKEKWIIGTALMANILIFSIVMYMLWNPVGNDRLWNLQARYFFIAAPLLWLLIPDRIRIERQTIWPWLIVFWIIANIWMIYEILYRYWL